MAIVDTINSMYENVGDVYDTITNVDVNNGKNLISSIDIFNGFPVRNIGSVVSYQSSANSITYKKCAYVEANKTYTLSWDYATPKAIGDRDIIICDENNIELEYFNYTNNNNKKRTFTPTYNGWVYASLDTNAIKVQLELGSSATEYQPYTDNPTYKNIENIPSTIRKSYLDIMNNGIDTIYDNWEKVNGTGTSISLNNTEEAPMTIEYKGNTSQETTTGKNLFNIEGQYETGTGITLTKNDDGSVTLNGTANGNNFFRGISYLNEQHTISYKSSVANSNVIIRTRTGTPTAQTGIQDQLFVSSTSGKLTSSKQFDFTEISIVSGTTLNNFKIYIQLEKGASETSFEPYTNGATPRPTYPQDIHVVNGDNSIEVCGKNLLDLPNNSITSNGVTSTITNGKLKIVGTTTTNWFSICNLNIPLESGTYIFSYTNKKVNRYNFSIKYEDNTTQVIYGNAYSNTPITLNKNATITSMFSDNNTTGATFDYEDYLMLEKGTTATTYEEYKGNDYEINLGKNLLNNILTTQTLNGITATRNDDGSVTLNGTATAQTDFAFLNTKLELEDGTYTFSISDIGNSNVRIQYGVTGYGIMDTGTATTSYTTTFPNTSLGTEYSYINMFRVRVVNGAVLNNYTIYPMIEKGSQATSYSPYFTPIELCKIGTYQDRIFKSSGKNLFNPATETKNYIVNSEGTLTPNNSYNSSAFIPMQPLTNVVLSTDQTSAILEIVEYDTNQSLINRGVKTNSTFYNLKTSNTTAYIRISYENTSTKVQFEKGSSATTYEPYGKDWYLNKQIGKVVLNGSESGWSYPSTNRFNLDGLFNDYFKSAGNITYLSNYYKAFEQTSDNGTFNTLTTNTNYGFNLSSTTSNNYTIRFKDTRYTLIADFKSWLGSNNVSLYYALATPTYEKITGELLNQLEAIKKSYENQTNINQENNDLPFELEVGALEKY